MVFNGVLETMRVLSLITSILLLAGCTTNAEDVDAPTMDTVENSAPSQAESEANPDPEETLTADEESAQAGGLETETEPAPGTGRTQTATATPEPNQTSRTTPTTTTAPAPSPVPSQTKTPEPDPTVSTAPGSISRAEVSQNNTRSKCWVIVDGSVHDLTRWINEHPGGASAIIGLCGKDASDAFASQHGGQARPSSVLDGFFLGQVSD